MLVSHWPELSTWPHPPAGTAGKCRLVPGSCVPSLKKKKIRDSITMEEKGDTLEDSY